MLFLAPHLFSPCPAFLALWPRLFSLLLKWLYLFDVRIGEYRCYWWLTWLNQVVNKNPPISWRCLFLQQVFIVISYSCCLKFRLAQWSFTVPLYHSESERDFAVIHPKGDYQLIPASELWAAVKLFGAAMKIFSLFGNLQNMLFARGFCSIEASFSRSLEGHQKLKG